MIKNRDSILKILALSPKIKIKHSLIRAGSLDSGIFERTGSILQNICFNHNQHYLKEEEDYFLTRAEFVLFITHIWNILPFHKRLNYASVENMLLPCQYHFSKDMGDLNDVIYLVAMFVRNWLFYGQDDHKFWCAPGYTIPLGTYEWTITCVNQEASYIDYIWRFPDTVSIELEIRALLYRHALENINCIKMHVLKKEKLKTQFDIIIGVQSRDLVHAIAVDQLRVLTAACTFIDKNSFL